MSNEVSGGRKPSFWSLDLLWLVPWALFLFVGLYQRVCDTAPMLNPCRMMHSELRAAVITTKLLKTIPSSIFLVLIFARWLLLRLRSHKAWLFLGLLGVPLAFDSVPKALYVKESDIERRALVDCKNLADALIRFHKDNGEWPYFCSPYSTPGRVPCLDYLYGNIGDMPNVYQPAWLTWGTEGEDMLHLLIENNKKGEVWYRPSADATGATAKGWDGPYMHYSPDDPWSNRYLISVGGFEGGPLEGCYVWCISAGPNECLETPADAVETVGDDIGYRATDTTYWRTYWLKPGAKIGKPSESPPR